MAVNGRHHLPCLSGSSQVPLLANDRSETGSERSTPSSAHLVGSPCRLNQGQSGGHFQRSVSQHQHHHHLQQQSQQQQPHQQQLIQLQQQQQPQGQQHQLGTPLMSQSGVFFPPPTMRPIQAQHKLGRPTHIALELAAITNASAPSPKSTDINMNAEHEHDREACLPHAPTSPKHLHHHQQTHAKQQSQIQPARRANGSQVSSPLSAPSKHLPVFFPDSHNFANLIRQQQATPTPRMSNSSSAKCDNGNSFNNDTPDWNQRDDSYHLYHEPIDLDEQNSAAESGSPGSQLISPDHTMTATSQQQPTGTRLSSPRSPLNSAHCPLPLLPPPQSRSSLSNVFSGTSNASEWSFRVPQTAPLSASSVQQQQSTFTMANSGSRTISFADRVGTSRQKDVSDDIYFCYVTLKSTERANHRSRSYHGPKNNGSKTIHLSSSTRDGSKNLSSSSFEDLPTSPAALTSNSATKRECILREHCIRELIETESNYVHALDMIISSFARPLEVCLRKDDHSVIFKPIEQFHQTHSAFLTDLVKAAIKSHNLSRDFANLPIGTRNALAESQTFIQTASNPSTPTAVGNIPQFLSAASPSSSPLTRDLPISPAQLFSSNKSANGGSHKISTCFLNFRDKFLAYGKYCATLSKTQALLDELSSKNDAVAAQLDRCQHDANEGKFKLRDLLSLPMQRILKYHLLLQQLIKSTHQSNDDYHGLKRAYETMVDLGQYINEVKRDTEALQIINDIEKSITMKMPDDTQLTDYGRLVIDGSIRIRALPEAISKGVHDAKVKQKRYVFVFDKVMLICKETTTRSYQFKDSLIMSEFKVDTNPILTQTEPITKHTKDKWNFSFSLVSARKTYCLYAKTQEMKVKWMNAIQKAIDNNRPTIYRSDQNHEKNHEFLMHTFEKATFCDHCGKLLHGLYYQGYRCCICFTSAHKRCLAFIRPCGPNIIHRPGIGPLHSNNRCDEPPSPSVRSNCSDDARSAFPKFNMPNSTSTQCVDLIARNGYSNLQDRDGTLINPSSSFRENGSRTTGRAQRPISSMINVSSQNSSNQLLQRRATLKGSNSTPAISHRAGLKAMAVVNHAGNDLIGLLDIRAGDTILVSRNSMKPSQSGNEGVDHDMSLLNLEPNSPTPSAGCVSWWFGKNMRTGDEGRFPPDVVELLSDQGRPSLELEADAKENEAHAGELGNSYVNFVLADQPWYLGRMERDKAEILLQDKPHGTFLVRVSPKHNGSYVISLNYSSQIKHMRIYISADNQLYLSLNRHFKSVVDLVEWYERNSLVESFNMLDARLAIPYKSL